MDDEQWQNLGWQLAINLAKETCNIQQCIDNVSYYDTPKFDNVALKIRTEP